MLTLSLLCVYFLSCSALLLNTGNTETSSTKRKSNTTAPNLKIQSKEHCNTKDRWFDWRCLFKDHERRRRRHCTVAQGCYHPDAAVVISVAWGANFGDALLTSQSVNPNVVVTFSKNVHITGTPTFTISNSHSADAVLQVDTINGAEVVFSDTSYATINGDELVINANAITAAATEISNADDASIDANPTISLAVQETIVPKEVVIVSVGNMICYGPYAQDDPGVVPTNGQNQQTGITRATAHQMCGDAHQELFNSADGTNVKTPIKEWAFAEGVSHDTTACYHDTPYSYTAGYNSPTQIFNEAHLRHADRSISFEEDTQGHRFSPEVGARDKWVMRDYGIYGGCRGGSWEDWYFWTKPVQQGGSEGCIDVIWRQEFQSSFTERPVGGFACINTLVIN